MRTTRRIPSASRGGEEVEMTEVVTSSAVVTGERVAGGLRVKGEMVVEARAVAVAMAVMLMVAVAVAVAVVESLPVLSQVSRQSTCPEEPGSARVHTVVLRWASPRVGDVISGPEHGVVQEIV